MIGRLLREDVIQLRVIMEYLQLTSFFSRPSGASHLDLDNRDRLLWRCGLLGHLPLGH